VFVARVDSHIKLFKVLIKLKLQYQRAPSWSGTLLLEMAPGWPTLSNDLELEQKNRANTTPDGTEANATNQNLTGSALRF
jgi:hypothetical protein